MFADSLFTTRTAGDRETGARCPHCAKSIVRGESIVGCGRCGAVQHEMCWHTQDGCGSFDCAPARRILAAGRSPDLRISDMDVTHARPLPPRVAMPAGSYPASPGCRPVPASDQNCPSRHLSSRRAGRRVRYRWRIGTWQLPRQASRSRACSAALLPCCWEVWHWAAFSIPANAACGWACWPSCWVSPASAAT